jgi:hypothetical protein
MFTWERLNVCQFFIKYFHRDQNNELLPKNWHWLEIGILQNFLPPNFSLARMVVHVQIMINWPLLIHWPLCFKRMNIALF